MAHESGIYVEILICACVDEIWRRTQVPDLHEQWDLRFTTIDYLPKHSEAEPQKFLYSTRIGFGLKINGEGESTGTREDVAGVRTSALSFWSSDPKSLIEEGSGYWQYHPTASGSRFLTWYDYRTRFGPVGRSLDRFLFRPLIGWATAWSFDRLRLWIERGIPPEISMRMALIHTLARLGIAFTWMWQGLVPKLIFPRIDEKTMISAAGRLRRNSWDWSYLTMMSSSAALAGAAARADTAAIAAAAIARCRQLLWAKSEVMANPGPRIS